MFVVQFANGRVDCTERKLNNKNRGDLGTRLEKVHKCYIVCVCVCTEVYSHECTVLVSGSSPDQIVHAALLENWGQLT